ADTMYGVPTGTWGGVHTGERGAVSMQGNVGRHSNLLAFTPSLPFPFHYVKTVAIYRMAWLCSGV
ncbi:MAG: hypothetical protein RSI32_12625, partial [Clostridia bacterium]